MKTLEFKTEKKLEIVDITEEVKEYAESSGLEEGHLVVYAPHATLAIVANENESGLLEDLRDLMNDLIPEEKSYKHHDDNATAHLRTGLWGHSEVFIVHDGKLLLGTWQRIMAVELDGPRHRRVILSLK
jgi:secondary thiamine-phosphate synthase enzyme